MKKMMIVIIGILVIGGSYILYRLPAPNLEPKVVHYSEERARQTGKEAIRRNKGDIQIGMHRSELSAKGNYELRFSDGIVWVQYGGHWVGGFILIFKDNILIGTKRVTKTFSLEDHPDAVVLR